ncbi:vacuolar membrane protein [Amanita muscaria]
MSTGTPVPSGNNSSVAPAWRQFMFFDVVPVKDVHDLESPPDIFKAALEISCVASTSTSLPPNRERGVLVADVHGSIHMLNRDFQSVTSWVAHPSEGRVTHMAEQNGVLVTIGEEPSVRGPILKIWDLAFAYSKPGAGASTPTLLRSVKLLQHLSSLKPYPASCIALSLNLAHLAIGFADGTVILYRHLDQSLASSSSLTSLPKVRVVHEPSSSSSSSTGIFSSSSTTNASNGTNGNEPITGLGFKEPVSTSAAASTPSNATPQTSSNIYLLIVTTCQVLAYQVSGKGSGVTASTVDEIGCGLGCAQMDWKARHVVVARDEAIYLCGTEGRGTCYAYEGYKSSIHTHRHYIVIISPPFTPSVASASATVRNFARNFNSGNPALAETDITKVVVFDLENKYVAYSGTFTNGVREVVSQWGRIYVLSNDGNLFMLQEKPTAAKLDILYRKGLYLLALNLAKTQGLDEDNVADIHKQYGDHLYAKADYDGAMQQYIHTIGHQQPSYVIRKFLDSQRIHNLVTYLQELHSLGLANSDHTTLLLNTYTKLKDVSRLDSFIKLESKRSTNNANSDHQPDELPFDLETAIRVCRQAGYFEHASYLAKKYERHEEYLRIQIEDAGNYKDALQYLRMLGTEAAESNLARYGRALLDNLAAETTQLLIDLCTTSTGSLEAESSPPSALEKHQPAPTASYLSYLVPGRSSGAATSSINETIVPPTLSTLRTARHERQETSFWQDSVPVSPPVPGHVRDPTNTNVSRPGTPSTTTTTVFPPAATTSALVAPSPSQPQPPPVRKISPRLYFAHFVDHMGQFLLFLETVAKRRWGQSVDEDAVNVVSSPSSPSQETEEPEDEAEKVDQMAVWNTLLELYLTLPGPSSSPGINGSVNVNGAEGSLQEHILRKKATNLLKSEAIPYDPIHALILCSRRGYTDGLVLLWERLGMVEDVLRYWIDKERDHGGDGASDQVIRHLKNYGPSHPGLYPLVLRFLTSSPELLSKHQEDVKDMLEVIDKEGIMPPMSVVQVLTRNNVASVGLVKEWLVKKINDARVQIQSDQELTKSYRSETATKLRQVTDLSNPQQPRVFHVTRCSACQGQLDLPSIHFMCDHSYHQRCIGEHDMECPKCARDHSIIQEIRLNNERLAEQHDVFLAEVQENGFEAVSAAFSRGVLGRVS